MSTDLVVIQLDTARKALAEAKTIQETKKILDVAAAAEILAKRQKMSEEAIGYAHAIKTEALARLGQQLKEMPKNQGQLKRGPVVPQENYGEPPTLADLGIDKKTSMVAQQLAALPDETRQQIAERETTLKEALRQVKRKKIVQMTQPSITCTVADLDRLIESSRKFGTIYVDPPWQYGNQGTRACTDDNYVTMTVDEIAALPVKELAAENSHLHLWTTNAFLFECQRLFEAWGFEYKSMLIWCKPQMGIGNYWRVSHEILLLGVRGDAKSFNDHSMKSYVMADRTKHSAKPEEIRRMIERASPGPYLEMFGRRVASGWTVWGNEIERTMFDTDVEEVA